MSGNIWLDWTTLSVSIFNTIIMLWMGLMILLSSDKRTWGVWSGCWRAPRRSHCSLSAIPPSSGRRSPFLPPGRILVACGMGAGCRGSVWLVYCHALVLRVLGEHTSILHIRHKAWLNITIVYAVLLVILLIFVNPIKFFISREPILIMKRDLHFPAFRYCSLHIRCLSSCALLYQWML